MARGFFAELNHQAKQAEKRKRQHQTQAERAHNVAVREHDRAVKVAERARAAAVRAAAVDQKAADREASRLYAQARAAEVAQLNSDLNAHYAVIDGLLAWTLEFDDFVDLQTLKADAVHPRFDPGAVGTPKPTAHYHSAMNSRPAREV